MKTLDKARPPRVIDDRSLGGLLAQTAYARLPARFYWILQTCAPWAIQSWVWGWHRTAGVLGVASAFGLWAIAQQRIEGHAESADALDETTPGRRRMWRVVRGLTAFAGVGGAGVVLLELFVRVMSFAFRCPGCAG